MRFDPKEFINSNKVEFDPKLFVSEHKKSNEDSSTSKLDTLAQSAANAATLGYFPEIQSALTPLVARGVEFFGGKVPEEFKNKNFAERTEEARKELNKSILDNPKTAIAGTLAGGLALTPFIPAINAASSVGRVGQAAKTGAVLGLLQNPQQQEGNYDPINLEDRLKSSAIGLGVGGASQGLLEGITKIVPMLKNKFKSASEEKAFKALGPSKRAFEKAKVSDQDREVGRLLLDENAIPILGSPKRIASRVEGLKERTGNEIRDLITSVGDKKVIDAQELAVQLLDSPEFVQLKKTPGLESLTGRVEQIADTLASNGEMTLQQAQKLRQSIDKSINFNKRIEELPGMQEQLYRIRTMIRDKMNNAINALHQSQGSKETNTLLNANRRYSGLAEASDILEKKIAQDAANRSIGLTDTIAGSAGAASMGAQGIALGLLNKAGRHFGDAIQARTYDALAKSLGKSQSFVNIVNNNPESVQSIINGLVRFIGAKDKLLPPELDPILLDDRVLGMFQEDPSLIEEIQNPIRRKLIQRQIELVQKNKKRGISSK